MGFFTVGLIRCGFYYCEFCPWCFSPLRVLSEVICLGGISSTVVLSMGVLSTGDFGRGVLSVGVLSTGTFD